MYQGALGSEEGGTRSNIRIFIRSRIGDERIESNRASQRAIESDDATSAYQGEVMEGKTSQRLEKHSLDGLNVKLGRIELEPKLRIITMFQEH